MKFKVTGKAKYEYEVEAEDEEEAVLEALDKFHSSTVIGISYLDQLLDWEVEELPDGEVIPG